MYLRLLKQRHIALDIALDLDLTLTMAKMREHWQSAPNMLYLIPAVMEPDILMQRLMVNKKALTNANAHRTENVYLMQGLTLIGISTKEEIQVHIRGANCYLPYLVLKYIYQKYQIILIYYVQCHRG